MDILGDSWGVTPAAKAVSDACALCRVDGATSFLSRHISRFFEPAIGYIDGARPAALDPYGMYAEDSNDRRSWTFEVQVRDDVPITDNVLAWSIPLDMHGHYMRLVAEQPALVVGLPPPILPADGLEGPAQRLMRWQLDRAAQLLEGAAP